MPFKVLLVDDNPMFLAAVRQFLDLLPGIDILGQAHDGKSALALLRQTEVDLLLLDIAMPGMNGLELARAVGQFPAVPQMVFLSMHDNHEYRAAAQELGAGFVSKADFVAELLPMLDLMVEAKNNKPDLLRHSDGKAES